MPKPQSCALAICPAQERITVVEVLSKVILSLVEAAEFAKFPWLKYSILVIVPPKIVIVPLLPAEACMALKVPSAPGFGTNAGKFGVGIPYVAGVRPVNPNIGLITS